MKRAGHECMWSCEIEKYRRAVYRFHWGRVDAGDVRNVDASEIPDFDVLCAGFPCQSFSTLGKRLGFDDPRGRLFFEIVRIAKVKKPPLLFLENVKGLLHNRGGRTFAVILRELGDLGYRTEWQVLDSADFGLPQRRERVFIIGRLGEKGGKEIFPLPKESVEKK